MCNSVTVGVSVTTDLEVVEAGRHLEQHGAVAGVVEVPRAGGVRQAGGVAPHYVVVSARVHTTFSVPLYLETRIFYQRINKQM